MELGKIYSTHIDTSTQTTWLIDRLSWVHCENKEAYDTLHIRNLFSL